MILAQVPVEELDGRVASVLFLILLFILWWIWGTKKGEG